MKRWLCLTLVVVLCIGLCACGKEPMNTAAPTSGPTQTQPSSTVGDGLKLKECIDDVTWYQVFIDENGVSYGNRAIQTLNDGTYLVDGIETGTWQINRNIVEFDLTAGQTYVLNEANGVYYLVGNGVIWTSDRNTGIPSNVVQITQENWEIYFEVQSCPLLSWQEGEKQPYHIAWIIALALREEYKKQFIASTISIFHSINGAEYSCENMVVAFTEIGGSYHYEGEQLSYILAPTEVYGFALGPMEYGEKLDFQVSSIEGKLTLVDLPLTVVEYPS